MRPSSKPIMISTNFYDFKIVSLFIQLYLGFSVSCAAHALKRERERAYSFSGMNSDNSLFSFFVAVVHRNNIKGNIKGNFLLNYSRDSEKIFTTRLNYNFQIVHLFLLDFFCGMERKY